MDRDVVDWHVSSEDTHCLTSLLGRWTRADYPSLHNSLHRHNRPAEGKKQGRRAKSIRMRGVAAAMLIAPVSTFPSRRGLDHPRRLLLGRQAPLRGKLIN